MLQLHAILERLKSGDETVEEARLDLKRQWPSLHANQHKEEVRQEFWKDICALANSAHPSAGYLVFGLTTQSPFVHDAPLPMDEASIQQILAAGIYPVPTVQFFSENLDGKTITVAKVTSTARALPHVARYKGVQVPWVRQGSTTRAASHLDLLAMFDARSGAESRAILRSRTATFRWANAWSSLGSWAWTPIESSAAANAPLPGLQMDLQLLNAGKLETAIVHLSLTIEWQDDASEVNVAYGTPQLPIKVPSRAGAQVLALFTFTEPARRDPMLANRVVVAATDIDDQVHRFEFPNPKLIRA